jgi:hypothetical protein
MRVTYLTWVFAGSFVVFGLPLLMTKDPDWVGFWAGLSTLSLGGFALSTVRDALKTGQIRVQYSTIQHTNQPRLFWSAIILVAAAGVAVLITGIWFLFFKG